MPGCSSLVNTSPVPGESVLLAIPAHRFLCAVRCQTLTYVHGTSCFPATARFCRHARRPCHGGTLRGIISLHQATVRHRAQRDARNAEQADMPEVLARSRSTQRRGKWCPEEDSKINHASDTSNESCSLLVRLATYRSLRVRHSGLGISASISSSSAMGVDHYKVCSVIRPWRSVRPLRLRANSLHECVLDRIPPCVLVPRPTASACKDR